MLCSTYISCQIRVGMYILMTDTQGWRQHCPLGGRKGEDQCTGGANPIVVNISKVHIQTKVDNLSNRLSKVIRPIIVCGWTAKRLIMDHRRRNQGII